MHFIEDLKCIGLEFRGEMADGREGDGVKKNKGTGD